MSDKHRSNLRRAVTLLRKAEDKMLLAEQARDRSIVQRQYLLAVAAFKNAKSREVAARAAYYKTRVACSRQRP